MGLPEPGHVTGMYTFDSLLTGNLSLVMAFNFIGDGVRDALDPRLRRSL